MGGFFRNIYNIGILFIIMKIEKKEKVQRVRIVEHNKKVLYWIIALLIILIGVIIAINVLNNKKLEIIGVCDYDSDCVEEQCCHAISCVHKSQQPDCSNISCTLDCEPNTLDCNQGSCQCINNKCQDVFNE